MIPVAILCGGLGTRAKLPINKCFTEVNGKPFILRLMEQMEDQGFTTFVLCRGTSGTLAALRDARHQLGNRFLVLYGDTYLPMDFKAFIREWDVSCQPSITATVNGIDAGVNGFSSWVLDKVGPQETSLVALQSELRKCHLVQEYPSPHSWSEVGTPEALAQTKERLV